MLVRTSCGLDFMVTMQRPKEDQMLVQPRGHTLQRPYIVRTGRLALWHT